MRRSGSGDTFVVAEVGFPRHGHVPYRYRHHPMMIQLHRYEVGNWFPDHYAVAPRELVTLIAAMRAHRRLKPMSNNRDPYATIGWICLVLLVSAAVVLLGLIWLVNTLKG